MVNASMKEGWGITNLEANACGVPVVSADSPGLRDSVKSGTSGLLYPFGDTSMLASTIIRVLEDDSMRQQLSEGAISWANQFTWDRSAEQMRTLCASTIATWRESYS
jgi:glycosyltransferase involved in cell wall biosynthesis